MRFVWAVVAFVLATLMIGAGIAQRTVLGAPKTQTQTIAIDQDVPFILIDGAILNSHDGTQTLRARGDGSIFAAYGRTTDLTAWLARADYAHVTLDGDSFETEHVPASVTPPVADADADASEGDAAAAGDAAAEGDAAANALDPVDSDLWIDEFQQDDLLITSLQLPDDMSLLVAADGSAPAPTDLSVTWPTGATTPWAGPLIVGGGVLMAAGLVLWVLGLRHVRRSRGPRRKGLPLLETEPIDLSVVAEDKGVISATPTRRQLAAGRRPFAIVPVLAITALAVTGCSADAWPQFGATPSPSASETVVVPDGQGKPAVTESQAERILGRIARDVADADEAKDAGAAAVRLDGPALAERLTNYRLRAKVKDEPALSTVTAKPLSILLPEANDGWPRTFLAVVKDTTANTATMMSVTQQDVWSDYKLTYTADLATEFAMKLAPWYIGAITVAPDSPFLTMRPDQLAAAYADIIDHGSDSQYSSLFALDDDPLLKAVAADREKRLKDFQKTAAKTGKLTFASEAGTTAPVSLATLDSGAIVAVTVYETETVTPTNDDAVIKLGDNKTVKALTGVTESAHGFVTRYADQLFFFVPAQGSSERIQLLGYTSNLLDAKVIKK